MKHLTLKMWLYFLLSFMKYNDPFCLCSIFQTELGSLMSETIAQTNVLYCHVRAF